MLVGPFVPKPFDEILKSTCTGVSSRVDYVGYFVILALVCDFDRSWRFLVLPRICWVTIRRE
jgi:hypothetical protein